jgi:hypothetical protein
MSSLISYRSFYRDLDERHGGSKLERSIWYHGTSSDKIPIILSRGLDPNPKQKSWDVDTDISAFSVDKTSYGGVYVTQNVMTANSSGWRTARKNKTNSAIVIMELQPRSLVADEDDFASKLKSLGGNIEGSVHHHIYPYMWETYGAPEYHKEYAEETKEKWCKSSLERLFYDLKIDDIRFKNVVYKYLYDVVYKAMLTRTVSYIKSGAWGETSEWEKAYSDCIGVDRYKNKIDFPKPPSPQEGERIFRDAIEKLTRLMKHKARHSNTGSFSKTARSLKPIGFSGSNRIICVVEVVKSKTNEYGEDVKVVYGELPEDFKKQWTERVGELRIVK